MTSNRFIKCVPKISELWENCLTPGYNGKMPFFCSQEGVKEGLFMYGPRPGWRGVGQITCRIAHIDLKIMIEGPLQYINWFEKILLSPGRHVTCLI